MASSWRLECGPPRRQSVAEETRKLSSDAVEMDGMSAVELRMTCKFQKSSRCCSKASSSSFFFLASLDQSCWIIYRSPFAATNLFRRCQISRVVCTRQVEVFFGENRLLSQDEKCQSIFLFLFLSAQTCLRHPECTSSRENRDTVFCHMRRAIDLVHYVVKDGILQQSSSGNGCGNGEVNGCGGNNDSRSAGGSSNSSGSNVQRSKEVPIHLKKSL